MSDTIKMAANGRDKMGRFAAGGAAGPGRPRREVEAAYLAAFTSAMPPEELEKIIEAVVEQAQAGNVQAARLLIEHSLGRPTSRLELADASEGFRVAGQTPAESLEMMMQRINEKIAEQRERKKAIANDTAKSRPTDSQSLGNRK